MDTTNDIAIISMNCRYPGINSIDEFWNMLKSGIEIIEDSGSKKKDDLDNYIRVKTNLENTDLFDADFFGFTEHEATITDPQHRLFLESAWEVFEKAGYDPLTYKGNIGLFTSVSISTYLLCNMVANENYLNSLNNLQVMIGNDKDHLASHLAYKLNIKGPCTTIQTACSSSLVGVHYGCESLLNGQSDMVLVGGITLKYPSYPGYYYREGGLVSVDGHLRAFDADASGTVYSNGLAMVVMKRLDDAIKDRDTIYAVIKGTAVNSDGSDRIGYTAPSVEGQIAVIEEGLAISGVEPDTIEYIEAHGSGTPLGDGIELKALKHVFERKTNKKEFCAIGSVKTNIGHVEMASGVSGLIKTALLLNEKKLVPSLNFEEPNPNLAIGETPFYVNTIFQDWKQSSSEPLRATVSSFGLGGINAFAVLEEYVPQIITSTQSEEKEHVLTISAKTKSALKTKYEDLIDYLKANSQININDFLYTSNVGRALFKYKKAIVFKSLDDLRQGNSLVSFEDTNSYSSTRAIDLVISNQLIFSERAFRKIYLSDKNFKRMVDDTLSLCKLQTFDKQQILSGLSLGNDKLKKLLSFIQSYTIISLLKSLNVKISNYYASGLGELAVMASLEVLPLDIITQIVLGTISPTECSKLNFKVTNKYFSIPSNQFISEAVLQKLSFWETLVNFDSTTSIQNITFSENEEGVKIYLNTSTNDSSLFSLNNYSESEVENKLSLLFAYLWTQSCFVDWEEYFKDYSPSRIELPTYPFERKSFWLDFETPLKERDEQKLIQKLKSQGDDNEKLSFDQILNIIKQIWTLNLGTETISLNESFFELGGNSLLATQVIFSIRKSINVEISLQRFFEEPTIMALANLVNEALKSKDPDFEALPIVVPDLDNRYEPFALTDIQKAYWLGRNKILDLGNTSTHMYFENDGKDLDIKRFNNSLKKMIQRHEMLRTIILSDGHQQILEEVPFYEIKVSDFRNKQVDELAEEINTIRNEMSHHVIDCQTWPLFDIRASLLPDNIVRVHISIDLLITDAWSLELLMKDLSLHYHNPNYKFEKLELSFRDYAIAQEQILKSSYYEKSKAYWMNRIDSLPQGPQLNLAKDPSEVVEPQFKRRKYILHKDKWQSIKDQALKYGLTPTVVLVSAFSEILALWSKKAHFTLNLTLFNRLPLHEQVNEIIGDFTSLTLLEIDFREAKAFMERAKKTQNQVFMDIDHRYFSGTMVTRELINRYKDASQAIIPVVFTSILNQIESTWGPADAYLNDAGIEEEKDRYSISQTPQVWLDHQVIERNGHLCFNWDVVDELFPEGMIDNMFECYCKLLEGLSSHSDLWLDASPLASYRMANPYVSHLQNICTLHRNTSEISTDLLHTGFFNQVSQAGEMPAIINSDGTSISYKELDNQSGCLSELLLEKGVKRGEIVAVVMDKSWHQIASSLGILRIGAAYLPIDSNYPSERISQLLRQSQCRAVIIASEKTADWHSSCDVPIIISHPNYLSQDYTLPSIKIMPEELAYVIYTSGSTGVPKGVMIDHRGAVNTINDINTRFDVKNQDRVLAISSHNFDLSVYDIFGILSVGGSIVIPDFERLRDPSHWADLISTYKVSIWNSVPALMKMLCDYLSPDLSPLRSIRLAMLSGDWIPVSLADSLVSESHMSVTSLGGATEASIWSIIFPITHIDPRWTSIPYGISMINQEVRVLNDRLDYCPEGVMGDLYIVGTGLSLGYFGDPELSADRFFTHPVSGDRLYRTGDLGRYMFDGQIEFLGRVDSQVKIGGYRIELGEIESVLNQNPYVDNAVVVVNENSNQKRLTAYIVPDKEKAFNLEGLNQDNIILSPIERMEFKLKQKSIRTDLDRNKDIELNHLIDVNEFVGRRSYRSFENSTIIFDHFSKFLSTISQHYFKDIPFPKYLYGSAGGLYPIQIYVYVGEYKIEGIPKDLYYYNSKTNRLSRVDSDPIFEKIIGQGRNDHMFKTCAFSIFLVGDRDAIEPMYGKSESLNFMYLEAGMITQLLEMKAPAYDIGLCQVGKIDKDCLMSYLKCKDNHVYFNCLVGGKITPEQKGITGFYDDWNAYQKSGTSSEEEVHEEKRDFSEILKEHLENFLPHYMIPADFVVVDSIPLTTNGKVDRTSLQNSRESQREPEMVLSDYIESSSETENILRSIWQDIFGDKKFSTRDNFFDLGGDSISIVLVYRKVQEIFGKDISMVELFKYPTLHDFATFLDKKKDRKEDISDVLDAENERAKSRKSMMSRLKNLNDELN